MEFVSQVFNQNARKQNLFAVNMHHDEILFVNFYFDKCINFWDVHHMDYIYEITSSVVEKKKEEILKIFSPFSP